MTELQLETSSLSSERDLSLLSQSSSQNNSEDNSQIRAYVAEFRMEVERKFLASKTNANYRFPIKREQFDYLKKESASFESLKDVNYYDLESQNVKRQLLNPELSRRESGTENLVDVIKKIGKLDSRYLSSQMRNAKSPLFKILVSSIKQKMPREKKSADSLKSSSIKTKSMALKTKTSKFNPIPKKTEELIPKNYLTTGYYHQSASASGFPRPKPLENSNSVSKLITSHPVYTNIATLASPQTNRSNYSPNNRRSPDSNVLRKAESFKLPGRLKKNFSSNNCAPPTSNKSASNLIKVPKASGNQNTLKSTTSQPIFNLMRKNFFNTNSNFQVTSVNPLSHKSRSKSKNRDAPQKMLAPLIPLATSTKNQINLTRDQLRSLIQKNIAKKSPQNKQATKLKSVDRNLSRSLMKQSEKITLNVYSETGSGFHPKSGKRKENLKK